MSHLAAPTTVGALLNEHPQNPVHDTGYKSSSNKGWVRHYPIIANLNLHVYEDENRTVYGTFDGPLEPLNDDDDLRLASPAYPPNPRAWRMNSESDAANWFHHEISNVVLAAFHSYPDVLQAAEVRPLTSDKVDEVVDVLYSTGPPRDQKPVLVIEMKRGLIEYDFWTRTKGNKNKQKLDYRPQEKLSRELRGYAAKYECPQIMCFDGQFLLMLQFRASEKRAISDANCNIDCWIFPRDNPNGTTLRLALYRFLVQGFRRCQGLRGFQNLRLDRAMGSFCFFNGVPSWSVTEVRTQNAMLDGWMRYLDLQTGAFFWRKHQDPDTTVWENKPSWAPPSSSSAPALEMVSVPDEEMEDDLYGL